MHFTPTEIRLIALHARLARPLHETVRALAEALPAASPSRILELAQLALAPDATAASDDDAANDQPAADATSASHDDAAATLDDATDDADDADDAENPDETDSPDETDDEPSAAPALPLATRSTRHRGPAAQAARPPAFVARMARDPMVLDLNRAIGALRIERSAAQAVARVDTAIATGKLVPAQREWALAYCAADPAGFKRFMGAQPALALAAPGTPGGQASPAAPAHQGTALSADEARICSLTRTDPQKFLARRTQAHAAMAAQPAAGTIIRLELD